MSKQVVVQWSQQWTNFRRAELEGILCQQGNSDQRDVGIDGSVGSSGSGSTTEVSIGRLLDATDALQCRTARHCSIMQFDNEDAVHWILSRSVLIQRACELLATAPSYSALYDQLKTGESIANVQELSFLPLSDAPINLTCPVNTFFILEEYVGTKSELKFVHFGRLIGFGQGRLKSVYSLPTRCYIGNTTMDPELSFIIANCVKAGPARLVLDPFAGTGGLLLACAHFGAHCIGLEINYQVAHGYGKSSRANQSAKYLTAEETVQGNFAQYRLSDKLLSIVVGDASEHRLWCTNLCPGYVDCIVADPPYGVREKGRKVGFKDRKEHWNELSSAEHAVHFPEKAKYQITDVYLDLLNLAVKLLVIGGRLAYWLPAARADYTTDMIPRHAALKLIADCEQKLAGSYSRHLIVMEKVRDNLSAEKAFLVDDRYQSASFREIVLPNNR